MDTRTLLFSLFAVAVSGATMALDTEVTLEGGLLGFSYNDVQIPNDDSGDRFDLLQVTGAGPIAYGRLNIQRTFGERHIVRGLYAPVRIEGIGTFDEAINFGGETFDGGQALSALYEFNTYRITYRYQFMDRHDWTLGAGITGLVRDANIRLVQGETRAESPDLGAVPLLHANVAYQFGERWGAEFDIDSLVSPQGRATDAALMGTFHPHEDTTWRLGYRTLEGGGDAGGVYTFAWLHYAMLGVSYRF